MLEELKIVQSMLTNLGTQGVEAFKWWLLAEKVLPYLVGLIITTMLIGVGVWVLRRVNMVNSEMKREYEETLRLKQILIDARVEELSAQAKYIKTLEGSLDTQRKEHERVVKGFIMEHDKFQRKVQGMIELLAQCDDKIGKDLCYNHYESNLDGVIEILKSRAGKAQ